MRAGMTPIPMVSLQALSMTSLKWSLSLSPESDPIFGSYKAPRLTPKARRRPKDCIEKTAANMMPLDSVEAHSAVMIAESGYLVQIC